MSLFAALVFSGFFFYDPADAPPYAVTVSVAFVVFSLLTSAIYIGNDIIDLPADKQHPFKKKRPIASGELPIPTAVVAGLALLIVVIVASLSMPVFFRLSLLFYTLLQVAYSTWLKHIPILDISAIATGFLVRVYAGAFVVNLHMSVWFLLTVISVSLFLAVGKRQSERTLLEGRKDVTLGSTRKILRHYSQRLLDQFTAMFATATWLTYALFTFQTENSSPDESLAGVYTILPRTLQSQKLLMITIPLVIFGVMRYLQLVYEKNQGESPDRVLLGDAPLLITVFLFGVLTMIVIYAV